MLLLPLVQFLPTLGPDLLLLSHQLRLRLGSATPLLMFLFSPERGRNPASTGSFACCVPLCGSSKGETHLARLYICCFDLQYGVLHYVVR